MAGGIGTEKVGRRLHIARHALLDVSTKAAQSPHKLPPTVWMKSAGLRVRLMNREQLSAPG
ncbi:hypothetical protein OG884_23945 [Streptosporangium sp. NBC_01755]|uniref:hypothetical protein n=1 Tax=unclassified Streptosporangium TaxID=2632669 RepID=UPI002DDB8A4B|nr:MULTISPECIES: hypothetical protein [unclassified Streptosporangium]WSA23989.1 hypothetical protein OIE13_23965 [Streptosporangium sp. NBC_01810]WSC97935.1 hypothetical protein OG884_23945 [Streptosporangium sp. NBC_01755]